MPQNPFEPPVADAPGSQHVGNQHVSGLANKTVIFGVLGFLCCGIVFGPLAIQYANQAEAAMITMDSGQQSAGTIKLGRVLGYIAIVLWVLGMIVRLGGLLVK